MLLFLASLAENRKLGVMIFLQGIPREECGSGAQCSPSIATITTEEPVTLIV
jgi:hypothetical protein